MKIVHFSHQDQKQVLTFLIQCVDYIFKKEPCSVNISSKSLIKGNKSLSEQWYSFPHRATNIHFKRVQLQILQTQLSQTPFPASSQMHPLQPELQHPRSNCKSGLFHLDFQKRLSGFSTSQKEFHFQLADGNLDGITDESRVEFC